MVFSVPKTGKAFRGSSFSSFRSLLGSLLPFFLVTFFLPIPFLPIPFFAYTLLRHSEVCRGLADSVGVTIMAKRMLRLEGSSVWAT